MRRWKIASLAAFAGLLSLFVCNRWIALGDQSESFHRLWQFYVSYGDFGFARRELFGTILTITGLNQIFSDAYDTAYFIYSIEIAIFAALIGTYLVWKRPFDYWLYYFVVLLSPAFILQQGYTGDTQDLELLIIAAVLILYLDRLWLFALGCCIGVITHGLFVFMLPALFFIHYENVGYTIPKYIGSSLPVLGTIAMILVVGTVNASQSQYEAVMAAKMPQAAYKDGLWSGYFETSSSISQNQTMGEKGIINRIPGNWRYLAIPFLYAVLCAVLLFTCYDAALWKRILLSAVALFPLSAIILGSDIYRWIGVSSDMALFALIVLNKRLIVPKWTLILLACFTLVAPFGSNDWTRPFPAQSIIYEHLAPHLHL